MQIDALPASLSTERVLVAVLQAMKKKYRGGTAVNLADVIDPLGARVLALGSALLALPFLWPLSLGPLTAPASAVIVVLALFILRGGEGLPAIPSKLREAPVPRGIHSVMAKLVVPLVRLKRRFSRRRWLFFVEGARGRFLCGAGLVIGAVLLAVPVPGIPFTNTFPALGIILFGLGWLEKDGVLFVLGVISQAIGALLLAALGGAAIAIIYKMLDWMGLAGSADGSKGTALLDLAPMLVAAC